MKPYLQTLPCDPQYAANSTRLYDYENVGNNYRLYTNLSNKKDPIIKIVGCSSGCPNKPEFNYGISSEELAL